ncbi:MAG: branched-chain-amino-acid aminotransferase [Vicingaceae bacterium]|nr:MAG: branched-chain-amino-acid aminotransferase [Vicingaceae bacterium]
MTETNKISILKTKESKLKEVDLENLVFGKFFTDHMFICEYKNNAWQNPRIVPFQNISLHPACAALHYGQAIFEGLKAYKNEKNEVFLFRPEKNAERFNVSAQRLCMPSFPEELFVEAVKELVKLDHEWIPKSKGASLYIRPFMFASQPVLGVRPADEYTMMIFASPVNAYYADPLKVKIEEYYTRSVEGGTGFAKAAGNYAAALYPARLAQQKGYHQLIWTNAITHEFIEESGTMNIFFQFDDTLVTPPLDKKTILAGITRDSILTLAKQYKIPVEVRPVKVSELIESIEKGTLKDIFGAGTAATIAPIALISYKEKDYQCPPLQQREFSNFAANYLEKLRKGLIDDPFNWRIKVM